MVRQSVQHRSTRSTIRFHVVICGVADVAGVGQREAMSSALARIAALLRRERGTAEWYTEPL